MLTGIIIDPKMDPEEFRTLLPGLTPKDCEDLLNQDVSDYDRQDRRRLICLFDVVAEHLLNMQAITMYNARMIFDRCSYLVNEKVFGVYRGLLRK